MMKLFKSALSVVLVLSMLFAFAGCQEAGISSKDLTPDQHLQKIWGEQLANVVGGLGDFSDAADTDVALPELGNVKMDTTITINETFLQGIADGLGFEGDLSFLHKIKLSMETDMSGEMDKLQMLLALKDQDIVTLNVMMNMAEYLFYAGSPELNDTWIEFDGGEMMDSMEGQIPTAATSPEMIANLLKALPDSDTLTSILSRYTAIIVGAIKNVEKSTTKLEAEGVSQDAIALKWTVYQKEIYELAKKLLTEAKDDAQLGQVIDNFAAALENEGMDLGLTYEDLQETIQDLLDELNAQTEYEEDPLFFTTYVDEKDNIIGMKMEMQDPSLGGLWFYNLTSGDKVATIWAVEQEGGVTISFAGSGTNTNGKLNAEYKLHYNDGEFLDVDYLKVTLADFDALGGTVNIKPTAELMSMLGLNANISFFTLQFKFSEDTLAMNLLSDGEVMIGISTTVSESDGLDFDVPGSTVDAMDSEAMQEWASNLDLEGLMTKLRDLGAGPLIDYIMELMEGSSSEGEVSGSLDYIA